MNTINLEKLSSFGRLAVALDSQFLELDRISGQIERLDIESESGLERAIKLMSEFAQIGQSIGDSMQEFSGALQSSRERAESAARNVAERAQRVQARKQLQDQMQKKFGILSAKVKEVSVAIAMVKRPEDETERNQMSEKLKEIDAHLSQFIQEAETLKNEAHDSHLKSVERNAESLWATLQSARRKLGTVLPISH